MRMTQFIAPFVAIACVAPAFAQEAQEDEARSEGAQCLDACVAIVEGGATILSKVQTATDAKDAAEVLVEFSELAKKVDEKMKTVQPAEGDKEISDKAIAQMKADAKKFAAECKRIKETKDLMSPELEAAIATFSKAVDMDQMLAE